LLTWLVVTRARQIDAEASIEGVYLKKTGSIMKISVKKLPSCVVLWWCSVVGGGVAVLFQ
jgi:hypothetical protein